MDRDDWSIPVEAYHQCECSTYRYLDWRRTGCYTLSAASFSGGIAHRYVEVSRVKKQANSEGVTKGHVVVLSSVLICITKYFVTEIFQKLSTFLAQGHSSKRSSIPLSFIQHWIAQGFDEKDTMWKANMRRNDAPFAGCWLALLRGHTIYSNKHHFEHYQRNRGITNVKNSPAT